MIIVIAGPTGSGKSQFALDVADKNNGVIINADSLQIYKNLKILTSSPKKKENHYLYNFLENEQKYSVANWLDDVVEVIKKVLNEKKTPIIVGGTGMYISSLLNGLKQVPDIDNKTKEEVKDKKTAELYQILLKNDENTVKLLNKNDKARVFRAYYLFKEHKITPTQYLKLPNKIFFDKKEFKIFLLLPKREELYQKCDARFDLMIENGAILEVEKLIIDGVTDKSPIAKAIGFKPLYKYLKKEISLKEGIEIGKKETRNYAKRQYTWFRNQVGDEFDKIII